MSLHGVARRRAVRLLQTFFESDGERQRITVFNQAFSGESHDPRNQIVFSLSSGDFADHAVEKLLAFGCSGRGKHCLSLLLETMAEIRGRQSDPDYYELPLLLNSSCELPTRGEELLYINRLIDETQEKARLFSPLQGSAAISRRANPSAMLKPWQDDREIALLTYHSRKSEIQEKPDTRNFPNILDAFTKVRRAALLGAPGSGKSTTLRKLAVELAIEARDNQDSAIPLLAALGNWNGDESLETFLDHTAPEIGWAIKALSRTGRLVLLLDGLNEVPTAKWKDKANGVRKLQDQLHKDTPIFISCRREDYTGDLDLGLDTLTLEPLTPLRIRQALSLWVANSGESPELAESIFWQLAGDEQLAKVFQKWKDAGATEDIFWSAADPKDHKEAYGKTSGPDDELWRRHVPNQRSLLKLASNPFMLTMLFQVRVNEGELPRNRGDLFSRFINRLLSREGLLVHHAASNEWRLEPEGHSLLKGLTGLAWEVQQVRDGVLTRFPRSTVIQFLGDGGLKTALDCTLLEGGDELRFRHQLLQEYFTAQALQSHLQDKEASELWPPERWWERSGWEETAVLMAGFHAGDCTSVIHWLAEAQPEVAGQCILESGAEIVDRPGLLLQLKALWEPRLQSEPQPEARAAIGRALGQLNLDTRKGVGLTPDGLPDIDWVEISGGEFIYQKGQRRKMDRFFISRYPVTNAQYQAFLSSNPDQSAEPPRWSESNHPRETVSWHEAMAFCAWLTEKLGREASLPTEWQWERAARGTDGKVYPWGNEFRSGCANINETYQHAGPHYLARTSPVGIYPEGASSEGVLDLSGNVWEWCLNEYDKPDRTKPGGEQSRVLRGGSWVFFQEFARAEFRVSYRPQYRINYIGFRVVSLSPSR